MRDSILRVIDDLETKKQICIRQSMFEHWDVGTIGALEYVLQELQKVLDENPKV